MTPEWLRRELAAARTQAQILRTSYCMNFSHYSSAHNNCTRGNDGCECECHKETK